MGGMMSLARVKRTTSQAVLGIAAALAIGTGATPAGAAVIKATFDSSITSRADASQITSAFNAVASSFGTALSSPATIYVTVSWGAVDGQTMGAGALGSSLDNMYGYFSYSQVKGWLTNAAAANSSNLALVQASRSLPASLSSGPTKFAIASAEAKALNLISYSQIGTDGYIGFSNSAVFDYDPSNGVASNAYDFRAVAAHELAEVLGRVTGVTGAAPTWRSPFDLLRYSAAGQMSESYTGAAYFSLDGGVTRRGDLNNLSGGDRSDWLSSTTGVGDVQAAFSSLGKTANLTGADITVLQALGWGSTVAPSGNLLGATFAARSYMGTGVPEAATWWLMVLGTGLLGAALRRQRDLIRA